MKAKMVNIYFVLAALPCSSSQNEFAGREPDLKRGISCPSVRQTAWRRKPAWNDAAALDNFLTNSLAEQNCLSKINCSQGRHLVNKSEPATHRRTAGGGAKWL
jgi:hypothetical protein